MSEPASLLVARGLAYRPPGAEGPVLDGVAFEIARGEIVDVIGPSGSGKTTFLRALARLVPAVAGTLTLAGEPAEAIPAREWRTRVALLPQVATMRPGTVRENLLMPWSLKIRSAEEPPEDAALRDALAGVGLGELALDRDASRLSVGQAARVSLLRVVLTGPLVLLLDEPDANLDDDSTAQVADLTHRFARGGGAVLRVRHMRRGADGTRTVRIAGGELEEMAT